MTPCFAGRRCCLERAAGWPSGPSLPETTCLCHQIGAGNGGTCVNVGCVPKSNFIPATICPFVRSSLVLSLSDRLPGTGTGCAYPTCTLAELMFMAAQHREAMVNTTPRRFMSVFLGLFLVFFSDRKPGDCDGPSSTARSPPLLDTVRICYVSRTFEQEKCRIYP